MTQVKQFFVFLSAIAIILSMSGISWAQDMKKLNINTASEEELTQLKRIGPKYAQGIVEYRQKNGPFKQPEEIMQVPGIGSKTYELNKDWIIVEPLNSSANKPS